MGTRGPKPAAVPRKKRIVVPKRLVIHSDHELLLAQHMNERLDAFLLQVENDRYPMTAVEPEVVSQVVDATQILQHALIEGIETYSVRLSPSSPTDVSEDNPFLRGAYALGRKQSRSSVRGRQQPEDVDSRL